MTCTFTLSACALLELQSDSSFWGDWQDVPDPKAHDAWRAPANRRPPSGRLAGPGYGQEVIRRDLSVGMRMNEVSSLWGEPREVLTAGDPRFGNEKWIYTEGPSSRYGLSPTRIIYFESGRVVGWDTRR